jgi:hypothetical protein
MRRAYVIVGSCTAAAALVLATRVRCDHERARQRQERLWRAARLGDSAGLLAVLAEAAAASPAGSSGRRPAAFGVNRENANGQSALYFAALGGHVECVRALVQVGGASVSCRALDSATDAVRRLLRKIAPHTRERGTGGTLRTFATEEGRIELSRQRRSQGRRAGKQQQQQQQQKKKKKLRDYQQQQTGTGGGGALRRSGEHAVATMRRPLTEDEQEQLFARLERSCRATMETPGQTGDSSGGGSGSSGGGGGSAMGMRLHTLDMRKTELGPAGARRLAGFLGCSAARAEQARLPWLRKLFLFKCALGNEGVASVAAALASRQCPLATLNLCQNAVGPAGAAHLARALQCNVTLEALDANNNELGDEGCAALALGLAQNSTLRQLSLWRNGVGECGAAALAGALRANAAHAVERCNLTPGGGFKRTNRVPPEALEDLGALLRPEQRGGALLDGDGDWAPDDTCDAAKLGEPE